MLKPTFDAHMHIGKFGKWKMKGNEVEPFKGREITNAEDLKQFMDKNNIKKALIVPHYTPDQKTPFEKYNPIVIDAISKLNNVYGGIWVSPLEENTERTNEALRLVKNPKIKVLKISPDSWNKGISLNPATWSEKFRENMETIIDFGIKNKLILQTHTGTGNSDFLEMIPFAEKYGEKLKIQFCHMGGSAGGHIAFVPRFINWLKQGYNFFCDTSFNKSFAPSWIVNEMLEKHPEGIKNIFFASDNPWGLFESEYWKVEAINVDEDVRNKILLKNADEVYG